MTQEVLKSSRIQERTERLNWMICRLADGLSMKPGDVTEENRRGLHRKLDHQLDCIDALRRAVGERRES